MRFSHAFSPALLVMAILATACAGSHTTSRIVTAVGDEDLGIIKAVCEHYVTQGTPWAPNNTGPFVAILSETPEGEPYKPGGLGPWYEESSMATRNFETRNNLPFQFPGTLHYENVVLIGRNEAHNLVRKGKYETTFPDNRGYLYFWLPGEDMLADPPEAVVYVYHAGTDRELGLHMFGDMVFLKKVDGIWTITDIRNSWAS
ncbi:hypothetical protein KQI84_04805 [bacterium]|nr:hypothetical protein [bacterium]